MIKFIIPQGISDETKEFMNDVIRELNEREVIESIDLGAMRMLATSYEMYKRATELLLRDGPVITDNFARVANPAQTVATKNYAQVMKIMTEYGLTIKSRAHISSMNVDNSDSPLDNFFKDKQTEQR
ncbi:MAG: phage terminase small subunit P27 family [Tannerellaceae bacterium]|jgi:P27 family predicted phage terminase small subunit|nr:phage terminase small subunit P27 family [Tannerellaceae bacterium]